LVTNGIYLLYRVALTLASPVLLLHYLYRAVRGRGFAWLRESFGFLPASHRQTLDGAIWLHAVSVGEVVTVARLVRELRTLLPPTPLYLSTTTETGHALAHRQLGAVLDGIFYIPIDFPWAIRRVLRALRPSLVVVAETEIWPNLFREVKRAGAGLLIVNGRISDRAFPRYRVLRAFFRHVLSLPDVILTQDEALRTRFVEIGARPETTRAAGNLKYDFEPGAPPDDLRGYLETLAPSHVLVAASTMPPDEEDAVISAWRELAVPSERALLILAPRKPERFDLAAGKLASAGIPFVRRTALASLTLPGALLLDSIGELSSLFALSDAVFMGGTLVTWGGHNILEPAFAARPVVMGPYMQNFREMAADFLNAGAAIEVQDSAGLARAVRKLWDDPALAREIGARALRCAEAKRGALARVLGAIGEVYGSSMPRYRPPLPTLLVLTPLSWLWTWGGAWKRARGAARARRLQAPVVSVGNLTMGGAGKTPFVLYLAERLPKPAILTRGYGRRSVDKVQVLPPGACGPALRTGDEPQIFLRAGVAPVGIGADRFEAGRRIEREFPVATLLLDDGFQHASLARSVDIVLIDALRPFGDGSVFPLGRLREPPAALARAGIIVITRSREGRNLPAVERQIRRYNSHAPLFHSWVEPAGWVRWSGAGAAEPEGPAAAFCGLGNPDSFWSTLAGMGRRPVYRAEFADHHRYKPQELIRLAHHAASAGARALLTTEKDAINLPSDCGAVLPIPLYWLKIRTVAGNGEDLIAEIARRTGQLK
jgi:tetraacyldisaccharide 4'-kinase